MPEEIHTRFSFSTLTVLKVVGIIVLLLFLYEIREILLILLIATIIASALNPAVAWLQRKGLSRGISAAVTFVVFLGVLVFLINIVVPPFVRQFQNFLSDTPQYLEELSARKGGVQQFLEQYQLEIGFKDALSNLSNFFQEGSLFRASASIFQGFFSFITTIVIAFYMVVQGRGLRPLLQYIVPPQHLPYARQLFDKIENVMGRWLWAQVILMLTVGLLTYLGLRLLGVPNAGALATLAGILEVIPFIGPILSAMPAVIIAFVQSPALGIGVILLYIIVQQIENHVLVPKVMQKTVGTNPIAVILGILIGFRLAGVAGAVVAVPLIAIVTVIMRDMLERRGIVLEDAGPQAAPQ